MLRKLALVTAVVVASGGGWWLSQQGRPDATQFAMTATAQEAEVEMAPDMVIGKEDAPITIIEYASFTCPHCASFHASVFDKLKENYVDTGKARFVFREVYFDKFGLWAAMVARCGGEMRYFGIADMIYDTQREWIGEGEQDSIVQNLRKIGLKAGLSNEDLDACFADGAMAQSMVATYQKNATDDDISATPSFIIDGEKYSNMDYDDFAKILDEKLSN